MGDGNPRPKGMRTIFAGAIILVALYIGIGYSAVQAPETASAVGSTRAGFSPATVDATVPDRGPISVSVLIPPELALSDGEGAINRAMARGPYGFYPSAEVAPAASADSIAARRSAPAAEEGALAARMEIPADSQAEATAESAETQSPADAYYLLVTPGASADASAKPVPPVAAKSTGAPSGHLSDSETAPSGPAVQADASSTSSGRSASTGSGQSPNNNESGGGQIAGGSAASSDGTSTSSGSGSDSGSGGDSSADGAGQSSGSSAGGVVGAAGNAVRGAVDSAGKAAAGAVGGASHAAGGLAGAVGGKLGK